MSGPFPSFESRTASLRGLTIHYLVGGSGSPIVLVHGLGTSASSEWRFNLEALAAQHRVYAIDLPGFGGSEKPALDYSLTFFVDMLKGFLAAQAVRRVALMGVSFGGRIALGLAFQAPEAIARLVLVDALGLAQPRRLLTYRLLMIQGVGELVFSSTERAMRRLSPALIRRFWGWYLARPRSIEQLLSDSRIRDHQRMMAAPGYRSAYLGTLRAMARLQRLRNGVILERRLAELAMPILAVWGRRDHIFPASRAEAAVRTIPNARMVVFEDSGHTPQQEEPDRFNQLVLEFLRDQ